MKTNFKTKTPRDPKYLAFIRGLPCCRCGWTPSGNSHHTDPGGKSLVGSDYSAVPLCAPHLVGDELKSCHAEVHQKHGKRGFWGEDELSQLIEHYKHDYVAKGGVILEPEVA